MTDKKLIHYCWFGKKEMPALYKRCIETWSIRCPDFEIIRWDESNINVDTPFLQRALEKKQWAFLSDYIRMRAVYQFGGIYLDADMEVVKDLSPLLENECFLGRESPGRPTTGIFGCKSPGHKFPELCMEIIDDVFAKKKPYLIAPEVAMKAVGILKEDSIKIYPEEYFYPYNPYDKSRNTEILMFSDITDKTYAIHQWGKGWQQPLVERVLKKILR